MSLGSLVLGGFFAQWIDFEHSLHAQHVCSKATGLCRTTAHAVFVVGPELHNRQLDKLNLTALDGDDAGVVLGYTNWEKHVVNGVCHDPNFTNCSSLPGLATARVYNWGYDSWAPFKSTAELATSISAMVSIQADEGAAVLLPKITIPFVTEVVSGKQNSEHISILPNNFSTCSYQNGNEVVFHVVFSVAPVDDPTENLTAVGEYSMDAGVSWQPGKDIFFEDHIDLKNGTYFQAYQFDGRWKGHANSMCFRVVVSDGQQRQAKHESCMQVCNFVVPFHNAAGYCSSPGPGAVIV